MLDAMRWVLISALSILLMCGCADLRSVVACVFEPEWASATHHEPAPVDGPVSDCYSASVDVEGPPKVTAP